MAKVESAWKYPGEAAIAAPAIITSAELRLLDLGEILWVLEDLLPEGLTILAGRPKVGKSWLALQIARCVSLGRDLLDYGKPIESGLAPYLPKGDVLYLALEDSLRRLQERDLQLSTQGMKVDSSGEKVLFSGEIYAMPDNLYFSTEWPTLDRGGIEHLEKFLDEHPATKMIIIDVIQRVIVRKGKQSMYAEDYDAVKPLQELAKKRHIAILGIHHLRKQKAVDPMEVVSGSFGLTAGVDSVFVLQKVKGREARLYITGRDIREERELAMVHNGNASWTIIGDADTYFISDERKVILDILRDKGPLLPKEVAKETGRNASTIRSFLSSLLKLGLVDKDKDGKYITASNT